MIGVFVFLLSSSIILLTLCQTITVNLRLEDRLFIDVDFLFLQLSLSPGANEKSPFKKKQQKKHKKHRISKKLNKSKTALLLLKEIFRRTDVEISDASLPQSDQPTSVRVLYQPGISTMFFAFLAIIKSTSRSFICDNNVINKTSSTMNITLKTSPIDVVHSLMSYTFKKATT